LARRSLELRGSDAGAGLPGLRLLICMEYVYSLYSIRHIGRRIKEGMWHAFLCVACGMPRRGLHANPLICITSGLWLGGRLPRGALGFARRRLELRGSDAGAGLPLLTTA